MNIGVYIRKDKLEDIPAVELMAFIQITRIIASLRFWMSAQVKIIQDEEKIYRLRDMVELLFILISSLKEAKKTYFIEIEKLIRDKYVTDDIEDELKIIRTQFNEGKENQKGFNRLIQEIRDNISFHYSKDIYEGMVSDSKPTEDLRVMYAKSDKIIDGLYLLPYDVILSYIGSRVPEEYRKNPLDWLFAETGKNVDKFVSILEKIAGKFIKANGYKKSEPPIS